MNEVIKASLPSPLAITVPSLMVLVGILLNQRAVDSLRSDMRVIASDLRDLSAKVDAMKDSFHNDIIMLLQHDADKDNRITLLEERSKPNR